MSKKLEINRQAIKFIEKNKPEFLNPFGTVPFGILIYLMAEFAEEYHKSKKENG